MNPIVIDISHHNTVQSFAAIKASGILGVILKCTQGTGYADPTYATRVTGARANGLLVGAYHFNTGEDPKAQVNHFLRCAQPDDQMLMALDWEDNSSNMSVEQACEFLQLLDDNLGRKAVLYSGNRAKDLLGNTKNAFLGSHRLWLAQYGPVPHVQASWANWWLWQYDDGTRHLSKAIPGVGIRDREDISDLDSVPHDGYDADFPGGFDTPVEDQRLGLPGVSGQVDLNAYNGQQLAAEWAS